MTEETLVTLMVLRAAWRLVEPPKYRVFSWLVWYFRKPTLKDAMDE